MQFASAAVALAAALASVGVNAQDKAVFAHFITKVGNAESFQVGDWQSNIQQAQQVGIDGFALNIGGENIDTSTYHQTQLDNAYNAAQGTGFKLFISFDYAANSAFGGDIATVSGLINTYKGMDAQFNVGTQPMVSTFEGTASSNDWGTIKSNTGAYFCPDYTSVKGQASYFTNADCALSWDVWPVGATDMTDQIDTDWQSFLGDKAYMMGVSPWFYTDLPALSKTYTWRGNKLWNERWEAAAQHQPQFIEIITWNDFGESHYIGDLNPAEEYAGSEVYVNNMPHDGYRILLPYYIAAYKGSNATVQTEDLVYAHTINPGSTQGYCNPGAVVGNAPGQAPAAAADVSVDAIDIYLLLQSPADLSVTVGGGQAQTFTANAAGINYFSADATGQSGQVSYTVSRNGQTVFSFNGATISTDCSAAQGQINYNAITGAYSTSGSGSQTSDSIVRGLSG